MFGAKGDTASVRVCIKSLTSVRNLHHSPFQDRLAIFQVLGNPIPIVATSWTAYP